MIRGKTKICPFGLAIPNGCMSAGGLSEEDEVAVIAKMVPLHYAKTEEDRDKILEDNLEELLLAEGPEQCPFADRVFEDRSAVDCKFDENGQSAPAGSAGLNGSPMYPHIMIGNMPKAQYGYPINYYSDDNENTNVYYGIYSLIG
tara:strand:- start:1145 stop:1579 length:435 start_codon:yes stop_codon:yes gene_type:complete